MNYFLIVVIFWLFWLCFWSFSTVLIDRWNKGKWGILFWRSECPSCHHTLWATELIPLFSYLFQKWECKSCKVRIPLFYPIAEISMMLIFMLTSWISLSLWFMPIDETWYVLIFWWFITGVYILYDIKFMEIPDQIMVPWIYGTIILLFLWYTGNFSFFDIGTYNDRESFLIDHIVWAVLLYSFLYFQILIPWGFHFIKKGDWKNLISLLMSYFLFPILLLIDFFRKQKMKSDSSEPIPSWVWGWDLRIALFIWLTLGSIHGIVAFVISYLIGSVVGIIFIINKALRWEKKISSEIPFWPFLWVWWFLSLLFYSDILSYINIY